jgi:hypothetical protein
VHTFARLKFLFKEHGLLKFVPINKNMMANSFRDVVVSILTPQMVIALINFLGSKFEREPDFSNHQQQVFVFFELLLLVAHSGTL